MSPLGNYTKEPSHSFQHGEEIGFIYYFKTYYKALCYFANQYIDDFSACQDIATEGFIQLFEIREKIESEDHLKNYLYNAVYHLSLDYFRRLKTIDKYLTSLKERDQHEENQFISNVIKAETNRQVGQAIDLLPAQCKKIFQKLYLEGKSVKETASELGLTISTINNQKSRGIKILRSKLIRLLSTLLLVSLK